MVRVEGFSAYGPEHLAKMINEWLDSHPNFTSLDIQYRTSPNYNHCALVIYEEGEA